MDFPFGYDGIGPHYSEAARRIGLAIAPSKPDTVYAIVFAEEDESGFYRSVDFGETWEKRSDRMSNDAQYYNEITVDPINEPPSFDAIADRSVDEDSATTTFDVTGISPGGGTDEASQVVTLRASAGSQSTPT